MKITKQNRGLNVSDVRYDDAQVAKEFETVRYWTPAALDVWCDKLANWIQTGADNGPVLDLGSGTGIWSEAIARRFETAVVGVEPGSGMRTYAGTARSHPLVDFVGGTADAVPLADGSASAAWMSTVIHQFPDMHAAATELRRVLAPSAPVLIRSTFVGRHDEIELFHHFAGAEEKAAGWPELDDVIEAFEAAGFEKALLERVREPMFETYDEFLEVLPMMRHTDTALAHLDDDEWEAGTRSIRDARDRGDSPWPLGLDLLVFT